MIVELSPDAQRFALEQIHAGRFRSIDDLVDQAMNLLRDAVESDLDEETVAAINRAEAQFERGEEIDFDQFVADFRAKITAR